MSDFGIVCEFNPFHNGHKYLFDEARRQGARRVICVMSGNSVQRGELAVADKYIRAEAAIRAGADLVLELPYPWCSASAEFFAEAAVSILSPICDTLIFGSECGDTDLLARAADAADRGDFREEYARLCSEGEGSAKAYFDLLARSSGVEFSSNDLLGIEYIRAVRRNGNKLSVRTVKRQGTEYRGEDIAKGELPSATALRAAWAKKDLASSAEYMPAEVFAVMKKAAERGELTDISMLDSAAVSFFRLHEGAELEHFAENGGGLANRICGAARESVSYDELVDRVRTKRYTDARIRRAMLFAMTAVKEELLHSPVGYTVLLGASMAGRELLAELRKKHRLPIITKAADAPRNSGQYIATEKLDSLFTLARRSRAEAFAMMKKGAYLGVNENTKND